MSIHHQFIGDSTSDKLIIFLHEGLGSVAQWKTFPEKLCEDSKAYGMVYDRSGYGKSRGSLAERSIDYLHQGAEELHLLIQKIVPRKYNCYLYGHSDGGSIALIYAATYPKTLSGIITEAAHVFVEEETIKGVKDAQPLLEEGKFDGLKKYHGLRYKEVFLAWNNIWLQPDFRNWNISNLLSGITCPQLIIQGKKDQYGTLAQVETIVKQTTGKSIIFTPENCGHAPHKEMEKETLTQTKAFINGNE